MSPAPSAPQFYPEPVPQNMHHTNPPVSPQQYPFPDSYHPYAGLTQQNMYHADPPVNPQQYPVPNTYQPYAEPTQQNMYPTNPPVNLQQYPTLFINHNQNLNIRVSKTADPEITNRYITHFANIPNDSIDKVKLGMAVMHKFNQQNINANVVVGMDKNVNIDLVGLSDEDEETDGEIIDITNASKNNKK